MTDNLQNESNENLISLLHELLTKYKIAIPSVGVSMLLCNSLMIITILLERALTKKESSLHKFLLKHSATGDKDGR